MMRTKTGTTAALLAATLALAACGPAAKLVAKAAGGADEAAKAAKTADAAPQAPAAPGAAAHAEPEAAGPARAVEDGADASLDVGQELAGQDSESGAEPTAAQGEP